MLKEFAVLNHELDASRIHVHHTSGADVQVADFAIPHLAFGQSHKWTAGLNERVGIFAQQPVINRLTRKHDSISFGLGAVSPAVEDDEHEWFGTGQYFSS